MSIIGHGVSNLFVRKHKNVDFSKLSSRNLDIEICSTNEQFQLLDLFTLYSADCLQIHMPTLRVRDPSNVEGPKDHFF